MMEDKKIIGILESLRLIEPSADYAARSRNAILASPRLVRTPLWTGLKRYFSEGARFAVSVGLASAIIALFIGSVPKALDPVIGNNLPGAETVALLREADAAVKDIDVHLKEAQLFSTVAEKSGSALKETATTSAPHASPILIEKESQSINSPSGANPDPAGIDNILNRLVQ